MTDRTPCPGLSNRKHLLLDAVADRAIALGCDRDRLRTHGINLVVVDRLERTQRTVEPHLLADWVDAVRVERDTERVLAAVRAAVTGPILLVKGAATSAAYPRRGLRSWGDVDIVVPDARRAVCELHAAGFWTGDDSGPSDGRHEPPMRLGAIPLPVEVHSNVGVPRWAEPPPRDLLFEQSVPSGLSVPGLLVPDPVLHAVLVCAHSWAHLPFRSLRDLLDQEMLLTGADYEDRAASLANRFGLERTWQVDRRLAAAVFDAQQLMPLERALSAPLRTLRERSPVESLAALLTGPLYADSALASARAYIAGARSAVRPVDGIRTFDRRRLTAREL